MREIKFRAVLKNSNKVYPVEELRLGLLQGVDIAVIRKNKNLTESWGIDKVNLLQFTGLKDKFGNEIYEGDIYQPYSEKGMNNKLKGVIKKLESGLYVIDNEKIKFYEALIDSVINNSGKVIGNIYENPELMK